ncbi:vitamin K epoxide reductase complex subunit 1 isoform X2 [Galleria mellonella]|nr:vitamin K epoxide reductase complex subunit 1 isoform X2 [Galleria mellonella]XP_052758509.1 vitamin K epoxide reductase complex subunit 1 isoform X2 [Galleria mellonella]XP_052758510.1 vitamin K epoxide reductase complex subunit 1 isoform X2 [Galleria mellonella]
MNIKRVDRLIITTAIVGVLVSTYALYVEMIAEARPGYKALCDISEYASCSRVLTSQYSKGFGLLPKELKMDVPNCIYGIIFYCLIIFLTTFNHLAWVRLQLLLTLTGLASSFYLAYLLAFVLRDVCVVCISTYFVNGALVRLVYQKNKILSEKNK